MLQADPAMEDTPSTVGIPLALSTRLGVGAAVSSATILAVAGASAVSVPCLLLWVHAAGLVVSPLVGRGVHHVLGGRERLAWGKITLASWLGAGLAWWAAGSWSGSPGVTLALWAAPPFVFVVLAVRRRTLAQEPPRPLATAALVVVSLIAAGLLAELVFRAYQRQLHRSRTLAAESPWEILGGGRIYGLKRNHQDRGEFMFDRSRAVSYRTSSLGLRGGEIGARTQGVPRVLVIGDSYTFGWAVEEEQSYPRQATLLLSAAGREVEIINAGIPGYGTRQERALLAELLPVLRPDVVVLGFVMNDAEPQMTVLQPLGETYRCSPVWTWEALKQLWNLRLCPEGRPLPLSLLTPSQDFLHAYEPGSAKWSGTREALDGMAALCEAARLPLVVLVVPDFNRDFRAYPYGIIHDRVREWGAGRRVTVVDLLPTLLHADSGALRVEGDGHPNAAGHRLLAEALRAELLRTLP
jgi:lysophospholipase L1-like esterase